MKIIAPSQVVPKKVKSIPMQSSIKPKIKLKFSINLEKPLNSNKGQAKGDS